MSEDHERRISTVEANYGTLAQSMSRMEGYLGQLFNQQSDIKTSIALVVQNQSGMKDYQVKCDSERTDHEKRLTSVEGFQGRLVKMAMVVTGVGSLASPQLAKLWSRIFS
jgi:hypothetical protein